MKRKSISEDELLSIVDNTHDGILTLATLRQHKIQFSDEVCHLINKLIDAGILKQRDCYDFACERADNQRSKYGEQKYFNRYVHLKKEDLLRGCSKEPYHGLKIIISNDIGSCINSKEIKDENEGLSYFNKFYDDTYSYEIIKV